MRNQTHVPSRANRAAAMATSLLAWQLGLPFGQAAILPTALPTGGSVAQGTASIITAGSQLTINQTSANGYINWQSFDVGASSQVTFNQPSASSVTWNSISGSGASGIDGRITANGYVVLQNPNGFAIGGGAVISAQGLVITTAPLPMPDLSSGGAWQFNALPPTASIINYGQINLGNGGSAFLIASDIENHGAVSAPGGKIGLYSGQQVLVSMAPDGRGLSAAVTLPQGSVSNDGQLIADGGSIAALAKTVNNNGLIQASSVQNIDGVITLTADDNLSLGVNSTITANAIDLHALENIELSAAWSLADLVSSSGTLNLTAGNSIVLDDGSRIAAGKNWQLNLTAGTALAAGSLPAAGNDGVYLNGNAYLQTQNGDLNVWAANEVLINTVNSGNNGIRTLGGGNISVTALYGDVNAGANSQGYTYSRTSYSTSLFLGGISTAAGGNVTIAAGGDVLSYLPSGTSGATDAGTGAFGSQPGNVTITAGGSVYGHYVLANGSGVIKAGQSVGTQSGLTSFALSLVAGSWRINAPNGNIYLQEVRNPNGVFNHSGNGTAAAAHRFDYDAQASVWLDAGIGVYLTAGNGSLPRLSGAAVPVIYPPILNITAGEGGVVLQDNVILFPSQYQNLHVTTTDGGSLFTIPNTQDTTPELLMSDSSSTRWVSGKGTFTDSDHGTGIPVQAADPSPVTLHISGNMENLNFVTTKATEITVGGDMINCGFSGQNLHADDTTSITVGGKIYNRSPYSFLYGIYFDPISAADLLPNMGSSWDNIFTLALDPALLANIKIPPNTPVSKWAAYILGAAGLFSVTSSGGQILGNNPGFVYNPTTGRLGFAGQMSQSVVTSLTQPITILHLVNGVPVMDTNPGDNAPGRTYGQYETDTITWASPSAIQSLFQASLGAPKAVNGQLGYRIGGPGFFDINAGSISLGNSYGILSCGVADSQGGFDRYGNLAALTAAGATVNVTVTGNLDMLTSTIAAIGGGDVNVTSTGGSMDLGSQELFHTVRQVGTGIFTSGRGNVHVTALGDININGSRIATFNGGDIVIESLLGNVNAGSGGATFNGVGVSYVDPLSGKAGYYTENVFGSGIIANTLVDPGQVPGSATVPGNITVKTPRGDILASLGGILQEALNGNVSGVATIDLIAGTFPTGKIGDPDYSPGYVGNIDLGDSGVIGGSVNATANGDIKGLVISRQNSTIHAAQNFSGTVLAGGSANLNATTVSGTSTIVGVGGVSVSGSLGVGASVLGQNVSLNGGAAQSTLGSSAAATSTSSSAAQQANSDAKQQLASDDTQNDDTKNKKKPVLERIKRVTVMLPKAG